MNLKRGIKVIAVTFEQHYFNFGNVRRLQDDATYIYSKSEDPDPNNPANFFELSANLSKNATKLPKNDPK